LDVQDRAGAARAGDSTANYPPGPLTRTGNVLLHP